MSKTRANTVEAIEDYLREVFGDKVVTPKEFLRRMTRQIEQHPDGAPYYVVRAKAHYDLDDYDATIKDASQAIRLCPQSSTAWHFRGASLHHLGKCTKAEPDLDESIRLARGDELWLDETYLYRGAIRCDSGRHAAANADFTESVRLHPKSQYAYLFRGHARCGLKDYSAACKDYEKAVAIKDGDEARALAALAMLLAACPDAALRNGNRALSLAKKAVACADDEEEYQDSLAAAYAESGRFEDAVAAQQRAIKFASSPKELKILREQLKCYQQGKPCRDL